MIGQINAKSPVKFVHLIIPTQTVDHQRPADSSGSYYRVRYNTHCNILSPTHKLDHTWEEEKEKGENLEKKPELNNSSKSLNPP